MFLEIPNLLQQQEINRLRELANKLSFVDGRVSNPGNVTKNNLQADSRDPAYNESVHILGDAIKRCREFRDFALPMRFAPPLLCKYEPEMKYGAHTDGAYVRVPGGQLRTDVSCTIFIADPGSYDGGELRIHLGTEVVDLKYPAGHCVLYPSTTLHEVRPVTSGQRLVAITFVESMVKDQAHRQMIYELNEVSALEGLTMKFENRTRLESVKANLIRMWSA
jgi:PKHD-type hydroxylase